MKMGYRVVVVILVYVLPSVPVMAEEPESRRVIRGQVVEVVDGGLVLQVPGSAWRLSSGTGCRVWDPERREATLEGLSPGDAVLALGGRGRDSSFRPRFVVMACAGWLRRHALSGTVRSVDSASLVVSGQYGERVLRMEEECRLRIVGSEDASWGDIMEEYELVALGAHDEAGEFVARALVAGPAGNLSRAVHAGRVVGVDDESVRVQGVSRRVSVLVDDDTQWRAVAGEDPGLSDVEIGSYVAIVVAQDGEGEVRAQMVANVPRKVMKANFVRGEVVAVEHDCFILNTPGGRMRVLVMDLTSFRSRGAQPSGLTEMTPGDQAVVVGRQIDEHALEARLVGLVGGAQDSGRGLSQR